MLQIHYKKPIIVMYTRLGGAGVVHLYEFLDRVDKLLTQKGVKRPWLAKQTTISLNTINGWFQNNRPPRVDNAHEIARALGVSLDFLVTGKNKFKKFDDPLIEEICEYIESLGKTERQRAYGALVNMRYTHLNPPKDSQEGGSTASA